MAPSETARQNVGRMPAYFFDRIEDGEFSRGDYRMQFASVDEARREAVRALVEIARDEGLDGYHRELAIHIREDGGPPILRASLLLRVETGTG
jgi:hypothetical protein